jgi:hypothetical protein
MTTPSFLQASDTFFDLAQGAASHFGASYSVSDNYHDWFFSLGTAGDLEVVLAITVQGECSVDDSRDYFEGRIRLLGRPADAGEDGEFSHDIHIDRHGLYRIGSISGRTPLQFTAFNRALVSEHFSELVAKADTGQHLEVVRQIIQHEQRRLQGMCIHAGAPLLWLFI